MARSDARCTKERGDKLDAERSFDSRGHRGNLAGGGTLTYAPPAQARRERITKFRSLGPGSASAGNPKRQLGLLDLERMVSTAAFYQTFHPSDGNESALSCLMIAATTHAMDCFERAVRLDHPIRAIELNLASKLAMTTAALSKALDEHRGRDWPLFIDDSVASSGNRASKVGAGGESPPDKSQPSSSKDRTGAAKDQPKHCKN